MTRHLAVKRATQRAVGPWKVDFDGSTESGIFTDWTPTGTDYTIEAVVTVGAIGADQYILCRGDTDNAWRLQFDSLNSFELIYPSSTVAQTITDSGTYGVGDEVSVKAIFSATDATLIVEGNVTTDTDDPDAAIAWGKVATNNDASGGFLNGAIKWVKLTDHDDTTNTRTCNMDEGYGGLCYDLTGPKTANTLYPILDEKFNTLDGWEPLFDAGASIENGQVHVTKDDTISGSGARIIKAFPVVAGKHYNLFAGYGEALVGTVAEVAVSETEATGTALARIQTTTSFNNQLASFTAADSELNLLLVTSSNLGDESVFDNITVQEAILENGTFDSDLTGWDDQSTGTATPAVVSGVCNLNGIDSSNRGRIDQAATVVDETVHSVQWLQSMAGLNFAVFTGPNRTGTELYATETVSTLGVNTREFISQGTTAYIWFGSSVNAGIDSVIVTPERGKPIVLVGSPDWVNNAN